MFVSMIPYQDVRVVKGRDKVSTKGQRHTALTSHVAACRRRPGTGDERPLVGGWGTVPPS
jgi:hypothetical protein